VGGDMSSNGQAADFPTMVSHGGRYFYCLPNQEAGAATNAPPNSATNSQFWAYQGDGAPTAARPAWTSGMAIRSGGCLRIEGASEYATVTGMYRELDQAPAQITAQT